MSDIISMIFGLIEFAFFIAVIIAIVAAFQFNGLRQLKETVNRRRANVGAAIKKRADIMNRAADALKGHQGFEQFTTLKISQDNTAAALAAAYQQTSTMMASIQSAASRFPELQTSAIYKEFLSDNRSVNTDIEQRNMALTEAIDAYNVKRGGLPAVLFAGFLGFRREEYPKFETGGQETEVADLKEIGSRDDERMEQLLAGAGSSILSATKIIAGHAEQAGRSLAAGATQAGKLIADKVKEKTAGKKYFYAPPGGVPKGPATFAEIQALRAQGSIPESVMLAEVGSETWQPLSAFLAAPTPEPAIVLSPPPAGPPTVS